MAETGLNSSAVLEKKSKKEIQLILLFNAPFTIIMTKCHLHKVPTLTLPVLGDIDTGAGEGILEAPGVYRGHDLVATV